MPVKYFGRNGMLYPAPPPAGELWCEFHDVGSTQTSILCHGAWHQPRGQCVVTAPVESIYFFAGHGDPVDHDTKGWSSTNACGLILYPEIAPVGDGTTTVPRPERVPQGANVYNYSMGTHQDADDNVAQLEGWNALQTNTPNLIVVKGVIGQNALVNEYLCIEDIFLFFRNTRQSLNRTMTLRFYGCRNVI